MVLVDKKHFNVEKSWSNFITWVPTNCMILLANILKWINSSADPLKYNRINILKIFIQL
jgi:hypothetical protein